MKHRADQHADGQRDAQHPEDVVSPLAIAAPESSRSRLVQQPSLPAKTVRTISSHARLLRPQLRGDLIERKSLYPRPDTPFVVVVGPAGAGKTTLVSQWLDTINRTSTWLTLDDDDNHLSSFVRHLISAIQRVVPYVGHSALAALRMPEQPPAEMIGNLLADDLHQVPYGFVVVIDDFDQVSVDDVQRFVIPLLRHPAPQVTFVLISRSYPALPLARLRARGEVEEILAEQLRLSETDGMTLLQRAAGERVSSQSLTAMLDLYEGWAAGLHLAALAIRGTSDPARVSELIRLNGERNSLAFLFEEVFQALPPNVQSFLLLTSCVDTINSSLCDALLWNPNEPVDSASILKWLVDKNIFLTPLSQDAGWYRYHPVFRMLLQRELESRYRPEIVHRMMTRARDWFDEEGFVDEGIAYSLTVDEPVIACDIVKRQAQQALVEGNWPQVESWLETLPREMVGRDPELITLSAWCAWLRGRNADTARLVAQARSLLNLPMQPERNVAGLQAELDCIDVNLRWILDDPVTQMRILEGAFPALPNGHIFAKAHALFRLGTERASAGHQDAAIQILHQFASDRESPRYVTQLALTALTWIYLYNGDIRKAATVTDRLLRLLSDRAPSPFSTGWAHWLAGTVAYERNDLEDAARQLEIAVANREAIPFVAFQDSLLLLASIYQRNGQIREADSLLDNLLSLAESINFTGSLEIARAYSALFSYLRGRHNVAFRWLDRVVEEMPVTPPSFALPSQVIMARLLIARGSRADLEMANTVTLRMERLYTNSALPQKRAVQIFVLRSLIEERLGNQLMADEFMSEALAFVKPHGFLRSLIDLGSASLPVLQRLRSTDLRNELVDALETEHRLSVQTTDGATQFDELTSEKVLPPSSGILARDALVEPLTSREMEVLELLKHRLSNREIADALFISPQTVKRHNSNIFNKLGVSSRRQAIRRSEEIGLLPIENQQSQAHVV